MDYSDGFSPMDYMKRFHPNQQQQPMPQQPAPQQNQMDYSGGFSPESYMQRYHQQPPPQQQQISPRMQHMQMMGRDAMPLQEGRQFQNPMLQQLQQNPMQMPQFSMPQYNPVQSVF